MITRQEEKHNTPEQVREYLREGLAIVEEIAPPDDLREALFAAAVNLTASKQIQFTETRVGPVDLGNFGRGKH